MKGERTKEEEGMARVKEIRGLPPETSMRAFVLGLSPFSNSSCYIVCFMDKIYCFTCNVPLEFV